MLAKKNYKRIVREWAVNSTSHGLPKIMRTHNRLIRVLWVILFLASSTYCFYTIVNSIVQYSKYQTVSQVSYVNERQVNFPAVTICTLSVFDYFYKSGELKEILTKYNLSFLVFNEFNREFYESGWIKPSDEWILDDANNAIKRAVAHSQNQGLGFSLESDLLFKCYFNKKICDHTYFKHFWDNNYGSCYTFNSGVNLKGESTPLLKTSRTGPSFGLHLDVFVDNPLSQNQLMDKKGLHIVIHNNSEPYYTSTSSIDVPTGFETYIGIQRVYTEKLEKPYSDCLAEMKPFSETSAKLFGYMTDLNATAYSSDFCYKMCYQEAVINTCNCYDIQFPQINNITKACYTFNDVSCVVYVNNLFAEEDIERICNHSCPVPCTVVKYELSDHKSTFPTDFYYTQVMQQVKARVGLGFDDGSYLGTGPLKRLYIFLLNYYLLPNYKTQFVEGVKNNILRVVINYDDLKLTYLEETPAITIETLLGIVGGQLGLFIGISFLSFIELLELILISLAYFKNNIKIKASNSIESQIPTVFAPGYMMNYQNYQ